jgi:hypothetical protein
LAVSGASGGGTQTFIPVRSTIAQDALPRVMVGTKMQEAARARTPTTCASIRQIEIASLWAPRPLGMTTADDWTKRCRRQAFRRCRRWTMLGAKDNVRCSPAAVPPQLQLRRRAMYAWMNRHLKLGLPEPIVEEDFKPLTRDEATVWTSEHPVPAKGEAEERRVTSWWTSASDRALSASLPRDAASLSRYREVVGGALAAMLGGDVPWRQRCHGGAGPNERTSRVESLSAALCTCPDRPRRRPSSS